MFFELELCFCGVTFAVALICGILLWRQRNEVPDRSRTFLSLLSFLCTACSIIVITGILSGLWDIRSWTLLDPMKSLCGLYAITLAMCYPLEVMRPRQFRGRELLLLWLPSIILTLPMFFGLHFRLLHTWTDLWNHLLEWDVLIRFLSIFTLLAYSVLLLFIPYNWRRSSADYQWVRRFTIFSQGTTLFYCSSQKLKASSRTAFSITNK